jgi:cell division protein FtsI (penicillin-binding protein 3)
MTRVGARRATTLAIALLLAMSGIGLRLGYVQGVRSDAYAAEARAQRVRKIVLPARRGSILDRDGGELAVSIPARTIYANPKAIKSELKPKIAEDLAPLLHLDRYSLEQTLRRDTAFVYLARRIGVVTAAKIQKLNEPGIGVLDEPRRLYPGGGLAANVLGFIGTDYHGLAGLEYGYDQLLNGTPGWRILEEDPSGDRIPQGEFKEQAPIAGADIKLTIDPDLELVAERALADQVAKTHAKGGMLVALDPRTGEIVAMANNPSFDPNQIGKIDPKTVHNRVVTDAYEPGSINKVITASAALGEGIIKPGQKMWIPAGIHIGDTYFAEERVPNQSLDLKGILTNSSNVGTIELAEKVGAPTLDQYFQRFGYGQSTGLGFPGESPGILPSATRWPTSLPTMAIGQGIAVTALQIAQVYSTIADDGVSVEPRLVSGWIDRNGVSHDASDARSHRVIPQTIAREVRDMLRNVVEQGTGKNAIVPGYDVAGKTGTARKSVEGTGYQGYYSSFVGMLPARSPHLVMAVILDDAVPYEGGLAAAPVFAQVANQAVRILRIAPQPDGVPAL